MEKKICHVCKEEKDISHFFRSKCIKDGYINQCKKCRNAAVGKYRRAMKLIETGYKVCDLCKETKTTDCFYKNPKVKIGYRSKCIECEDKYMQIYRQRPDVMETHRNKSKEYYHNNPEKMHERRSRKEHFLTFTGFANKLFCSTKNSAKKRNLEFNLTKEWFLTQISLLKCEATGFDLIISPSKEAYKSNPLLPSIDRIDNSKGYTQDNCRIVCWWWNSLKLDWPEELIINLIKQYINGDKFK